MSDSKIGRRQLAVARAAIGKNRPLLAQQFTLGLDPVSQGVVLRSVPLQILGPRPRGNFVPRNVQHGFDAGRQPPQRRLHRETQEANVGPCARGKLRGDRDFRRRKSPREKPKRVRYG
jgi:hypothetical protein